MRRDTVIGIGIVAAVLVVGAVGWTLLPDSREPEATGRKGDACPARGPTGMVGLDAATGEQRWTNVVGDDVQNVWSPGPDGDVSSADSAHVFVIRGDGQVRRVAASSGAVDACPKVAALSPEELGHIPGIDETGATARDRAAGAVEVVEADGSLRWQVKDSHLLGASTGGVLAQAGDGWCCGQDHPDGPVQLHDPATGEVRWERELVGTSVLLTPDHVIVVDESHGGGQDWASAPGAEVPVSAYDIRDGSKAWTAGVPGRATRGFVDGGQLFVTSYEQTPIVISLDEATGKVRWTANLPQPGQGGDYTEPGGIDGLAVADGTVAVLVTSATPHRD